MALSSPDTRAWKPHDGPQVNVTGRSRSFLKARETFGRGQWHGRETVPQPSGDEEKVFVRPRLPAAERQGEQRRGPALVGGELQPRQLDERSSLPLSHHSSNGGLTNTPSDIELLLRSAPLPD